MNCGFGIQRDDKRRDAHATPRAGGVAGGSKHVHKIAVWILPACALVTAQAVEPTSTLRVVTADRPAPAVRAATDLGREGGLIPDTKVVITNDQRTPLPNALSAGLAKVYPVPQGTVFERHVVGSGAGGAVAGAERRIYSNTEGKLFAALGADRFVADDITTTAPHNTMLSRYTFQVTGKANPAGEGGPYSVEFALYAQCPQSVELADRPGLIIPNTPGTASFPDDAPRQIEFVVPSEVAARLPTNFFLGVKLSRDNVGILMGAPAFEGHSADSWDFTLSEFRSDDDGGFSPFACWSFLGGFPERPHTSFNVEIFDREDSGETHVEYKAQRLSGPTFNPGVDVWFADDLQLLTPNCEMVAYEVGIRGQAVFEFEFRNSCDSAPMPGTYKLLNNTQDGTRLFRVLLAEPVPLPRNPWFAVKVRNLVGGTVVAGRRPTIGDSADSFGVINAENACELETVGTGMHAAVHLTITCAGPAPKGACCDMFILDEEGEVACRQLAEINCPFPPRDSELLPRWQEGDTCEPNPFAEGTCGQAACCFRDENDAERCENLTRNECAAKLPLETPKQWHLGRFCSLEDQRCLGAVIDVPADHTTIQAAINAAVDTDEIVVAPGTYVEAINFLGKAITLRSSGGAAVTTIDGNGAFHVVQCISGEGPDTVLDGFKITGGSADGEVAPGNVGGGMYIESSDPTVANCTFSGNTAESRGGGMYNLRGSPTVTHCMFSENHSANRGGGMFSFRGDPVVTECTFSGNTADFGGGMYLESSDLTVANCTFSGNTAFTGGGMENHLGNPTVTNCTFIRNTASFGGGMRNVSGTTFSTASPTLIGCTFEGNSAEAGGGMYNAGGTGDSETSPTLISCTFEGNSAEHGAGMYNHAGTGRAVTAPMVLLSSFTGNRASGRGGALFSSSGLGAAIVSPMVIGCVLTGNSASIGGGTYNTGGGGGGAVTSIGLINSTLIQNSATSASAIFIAGDDDISADLRVLNSIVWDNPVDDGPQIVISGVHVDVFLGFSDIEGGMAGPGNIDADPMFARAPDDGGDGWGDDPETLDIDESLNDDHGDLRLRPGSPAIDAGNSDAVPDGPMADLAESPRFVDDPDTLDTGIGEPPIIDIGAHEYQPDCNGNGIGDDIDIAEGTSDDCNDNGYPDECDSDEDDDGVIDECDRCPESQTSETIMIGLCDTGVTNIVFDDGCTMVDVLSECDAGRRNHGDYVTCTNETARAWKHDRLITGSEFADIVACDAKSNAGRSKRPEPTVGKLTPQGKE